jgi:hypothetical protein
MARRKYAPGSRPSERQSPTATRANVEDAVVLKKALRLRTAGASWEAIAELLNDKPARIRQLCDAALREAWQGDAKHLLELELSRLDALQAAHWQTAVSGKIEDGSIQAARLCLEIGRDRREMLGIKIEHLPPPPPDPSLTRPVFKIEIQRTESAPTQDQPPDKP